MLGWEDQPILNGGVGKACFHLAEALTKEVDLTLIVPQAQENALEKHAQVLGIKDLDLAEVKQAPSERKLERFAKTLRVTANLFPYDNAPVASEEEEEELTESITTFVDNVQANAEAGVKAKPEIAQANLVKGTMNFEVIQFARYAARLASHKDIDVVYAHDWMTFLAGIEIKTQRKVPLVLHVHSLSFDRQVGDPVGWVYELEVKAMEQADCILAVSDRTAQMIAKRYGVPARKIKVVYNGCSDCDPQEPSKTTVNQVAFLGRMVSQKGPLQFLKIAKKVANKDKNVHFVMGGHGPQLEDAKQQAQKLGLTDTVSFTGFLPPDQAEDLLRNSGVYCLPALSEPFGLSVLEATQAGLPVVISKQTGAGEVLPEASVADYNDIDGMAEEILHLLKDSKYRRKKVEANQQAIKGLTWEAAADKVLDVLYGVTEK